MTSSAAPNVTPSGAADELTRLRQAIDGLDEQLLALLNQRARLALEVGAIKAQEGSPVYRPDREAQVIARLAAVGESAGGPLTSAHVGAVWREIMSACRSLEAPTRVAYLGPAGTFTEEAALRHFGSSLQAVACTSVDEVFQATAAGRAQFGVVPVENSNEGVVTRTLDLFLNSPLVIVGEISLPVRHNLLRSSPSMAGVQAVCAHPQALAQCHQWLSAHLPQAERRAVSSNAEGARLAAADPQLAALASERAASAHGLHVVMPAVQDDAHNRTRFAIITLPPAQGRPAATAPTGRDCTSLVVSVANRPGAVHDLLMPLKQHGVSMTRLESRPARSGQWEYHFYIDLHGHAHDAQVAAALEALRTTCAFIKVLGSYPVQSVEASA